MRASLVADPAMKTFMDRIALIEEATITVLNETGSNQSAAMEAMLNDVLAIDGPAVSPSPKLAKPDKHRRFAQDVYEQFKERFSADHPLPAVDAKDLRILQRYRDAAWRTSLEYLARKESSVAVLDKGPRRRMRELFLVLPLLQTPDLQWGRKQVLALPEWMRMDETCEEFEEFTLLLGRPVTALAFRQHREGKDWGGADACDYLVDRAHSLQEHKMYLLAKGCLEAGRKIAADSKDRDLIVEMDIKLAKLYADIGHPGLAAGTLQTTLLDHPSASSWGRASLLRLKYLYTTDNYARLLAEAPVCLQDARCAPYRSQIMYVQWVTMRREGKTDAAKAVKKQFLASFEDSPLAADMHFADAMQALAMGEYDQALRLLDLVRYRYPRSKVAKKAASLQERLEKVTKSK